MIYGREPVRRKKNYPAGMQRGHVPETNVQLKVVLAIDALSGKEAQCMAVFFGGVFFFQSTNPIGWNVPSNTLSWWLHALEELEREAGDLELVRLFGRGGSQCKVLKYRTVRSTRERATGRLTWYGHGQRPEP